MGQPPISDTQMQALHEAMQRLRDLERTLESAVPQRRSQAAGARTPRHTALLAATLLQLRPTDTLFCDVEDPLAAAALLYAQEGTFAPQHQASHWTVPAAAATVAAGHALAQAASTRAGDDAPVTVCLLRQQAGGLPQAMALASEAVLPLLFLVQCGNAAHTTLLESLPNVEVVRVDANDAIACCRVMQESLLRTRNRWGSVVLQAMTLPNSMDPMVALEAHLRRRNLAFSG